MKTYLYSNLKFFRARNAALSMAEFEGGRQAGYISRYKDRELDLPIEVLYNASQTLGIPMEELLTRNFAGENQLEQIRREIARLKDEERQLTKSNGNET